MRYDPGQLETLVAITEAGTFEAAARRLSITPSAVSQRVRALERAAGQVLIRRTTPATPTPAAETLLRLGRQFRLLEDEVNAALATDAVTTLAVAVNADSLGTWFRDVLTEVATWDGAELKLSIEDQAYSHDLLRRGEVVASVTSEPLPVQGCVVEPLGRMRYTPAATPELVERYRKGRSLDWSGMPVIVFNEKDHLQHDVVDQRGAEPPRIVHRVPSSADFHEAVRCGLGWGMLLDPQLEPDLRSGAVVRLPGTKPVHVPLYWQRWRLESPLLDDLSEAVRRAAAD